jgi:hypothetical protein
MVTLASWFILVNRGLAYSFLLGWNTLAAARSYTRRTRQPRFPLWRCVAAAAVPTLLPVTPPFALDRLVELGRDGKAVAFFVTWGLSFWASGALERRLPPSVSKGDHSRAELLDLDFEEPFIYKKSG